MILAFSHFWWKVSRKSKNKPNWLLIIVFISSDEADFARNWSEKFPRPDLKFFWTTSAEIGSFVAVAASVCEPDLNNCTAKEKKN